MFIRLFLGNYVMYKKLLEECILGKWCNVKKFVEIRNLWKIWDTINTGCERLAGLRKHRRRETRPYATQRDFGGYKWSAELNCVPEETVCELNLQFQFWGHRFPYLRRSSRLRRFVSSPVIQVGGDLRPSCCSFLHRQGLNCVHQFWSPPFFVVVPAKLSPVRSSY